MAKQDIVRVLRVLEYTGPRDWVENTMEANAVKGEKVIFDKGEKYVIKEGIIGTFPTIIEKG